MNKYIILISVSLLIVSLLIILVFKENKIAPQVIRTTIQKTDFPDNLVVGAYVWESPDELSTQTVDELLSFAESQRINLIYLNISKYLDIIEKNENIYKINEVKEFEDALTRFISESKKRNITIHALSGGTKWVNSSHEYISPKMLNYVFDFNKRNPETKFSGFQFDIEYYSEDGYNKNKSEYSSNYLKLVNKLSNSVSKHNKSNYDNFQLGFAIPFWFDSKNGDFVFNKLSTEISKIDNSYLVIMAYRNYQYGLDGTINLIMDEMNYVKNNNLKVSIIVAQETAYSEISKITFYGMNSQDLKSGFARVLNAYKGFDSLCGIAIHHLSSFREMKD